MDTMVYVFELLALVIGAFSCFAGYRVLKTIVPICSFAVGAAIGVIVAVKFDMVIGIAVMVVLGLMLSIVSFKLYKSGVFSVVAFMAGIGVYISSGKMLVSSAVGIVIGLIAIFLVKHISILITALSGASIVIWSALMLVDIDVKQQLIVWLSLWLVIAAVGIVCQYLTSRTESTEFNEGFFAESDGNETFGYNEKKHPGMQRAYRNFCIKCGYEMYGTSSECTRCGFNFDD